MMLAREPAIPTLGLEKNRRNALTVLASVSAIVRTDKSANAPGEPRELCERRIPTGLLGNRSDKLDLFLFSRLGYFLQASLNQFNFPDGTESLIASECLGQKLVRPLTVIQPVVQQSKLEMSIGYAR